MKKVVNYSKFFEREWKDHFVQARITEIVEGMISYLYIPGDKGSYHSV